MFSPLVKYLLKRKFSFSEPATLVVGMDKKSCGVGFEGQIPWKVSGDMKHFKAVTTQNEHDCKNIIVCGNNTFKSLGKNSLPGRHTIVISKSIFDKRSRSVYGPNLIVEYENKDCIVCNDIKNKNFVIFIREPEFVLQTKAYIENRTKQHLMKLFIIGGPQIYNLFMNGVRGITITKAFVTSLNFDSYTNNDEIIPKFNGRYDAFFDYEKLKSFMTLESSSNKIIGNEKHIVEFYKIKSIRKLLSDEIRNLMLFKTTI